MKKIVTPETLGWKGKVAGFGPDDPEWSDIKRLVLRLLSTLDSGGRERLDARMELLDATLTYLSAGDSTEQPKQEGKVIPFPRG